MLESHLFLRFILVLSQGEDSRFEEKILDISTQVSIHKLKLFFLPFYIYPLFFIIFELFSLVRKYSKN